MRTMKLGRLTGLRVGPGEVVRRWAYELRMNARYNHSSSALLGEAVVKLDVVFGNLPWRTLPVKTF